MNNISLIIPIYNEEGNIRKLFQEIIFNIDELNQYNFEVIFINDFSTDNSLNILNELLENNSILTILDNKKNLGQSKSILFGIKKAKYENIITMDGDGQNNPIDLKKIINIYFSENADLVSGIRKNRKDNYIKVYSSKIANIFRSYFLKDKCKDTGCSLKIFKKDMFLSFPFFDGIHRFIPSLFNGYDQKVIFIDVEHRPRDFGSSKYGTIKRLFNGIVDMIRVFFIIKRYKRNKNYRD